MMHQLAMKKFSYFQNEIVEMIQLPYKGQALSMYVLLPQQNMQLLENNLNNQQFLQWRQKLTPENIDLYLPKFSIEWSEKLIKPLEQMGIQSIFNSNADLSGIDGNKDLIVSKIIQKAIISVDEFGTEAAAATVVVIDYTAYIDDPIEFKVNRPFIFIIMHEEMELILFMGKLVNPQIIKNNYQMSFENDSTDQKKFI